MKKRVLTTIILILSGFILFSTIFFIRSNRPMRRAREEAVEIAKEYTDLDKVDSFYWFVREKTYFSLTGTTDQGKEIAVIIPKDGGKVTVLNQKDGETENDVLKKITEKTGPNKIIKINLGMVEDIPAWEVVVENDNNTYDYYIVEFKSGKVTSIIKNI